MTRRYVRLTLFALLLLTLGGAIYQIALLERSLADVDLRAEASARAAAGAIDALLDIRASERAFLAEGQGAPYWRARIEGATGRLSANMTVLRSSAAAISAAAPAATSAHGLFETTDEVLARLLRVESRIGEHALAGRRPHAEDLIFADALEASTSVERDVRAAAAALAGDARLQQRDLRERELIVAALAAAVSMLVALLLVPIGQRPVAADADSTSRAEGAPATTSPPDLPLNLRAATPSPSASMRPPAAASTARPASTPQTASTLATGSTQATESTLATGSTVATGPTPPIQVAGSTQVAGPSAARFAREQAAAVARLSSAADLCAALARVQDTRDLPALLAHITRVLDAHGTIVWLADSTERVLKPALAHGYRDAAILRLGTIAFDAPNPAAEAFRRRDARLVSPIGGAPGAVIVPLVSAAGCAGVVTLELKAGESKAGEPVTAPEPDAATMALARIFVAQLAGFIAAPAPATTAAPAPADVERATAATPAISS